MTGAIGRSLELYYIDGRPDGMLTAEMFNWTGHVLMAPRTQIGPALARPEAAYAGVYLLIGEQDGTPRAYIGEGEDISARIRAHDVRKEWWTSAVLVTASANKLNKAHVRYLEARLIEEASAIGRVPLDNATSPGRPMLSEADIAKMEAFLDNLLIVLPAVRVDMFIQRLRPAARLIPDIVQGGRTTPADPAAVPVAQAAVRFVLAAPKRGIRATAILIDGEFVVEAGSTARASWVGQGSHGYGQLFDELRRANVLAPQSDGCIFTQNYAFRSPSAAASAVNGRSSNGQVDWRTEADGSTYRDWEAGQLAQGQTEVAGVRSA